MRRRRRKLPASGESAAISQYMGKMIIAKSTATLRIVHALLREDAGFHAYQMLEAGDGIFLKHPRLPMQKSGARTQPDRPIGIR